MKKLGAGSLAISGISATAAGRESASVGNTEELSKREAYRSLIESMDYDPLKEMRAYLGIEKNVRINTNGLSGKKIILEDQPTHVLLSLPIATTGGDEGTLLIRVFDETATATVDIDGTVYKSNPDTIDSEVSITSSTGESYGVVTAEQWREHSRSDNDGITIQKNCDTSFGPVDTGGPLCKLVSGTALLAGTAATVIPEPGSTALGVVVLTGATGGSCTIGEAIDDLYETCNVSKVKMCVEYNCNLDPISGVWCDPEITIWSPDCN